MRHRHLLILLGVVLISAGVTGRGWLLLAAWLGCDFLVLGFAHGQGVHRIFGKRSDGTLPVWSWLAFLPLHLLTTAVWHFLRWISREPAYNSISDSLIIGRRLLPSELDQEFANYIDLTAEFTEPLDIRCMKAYQCFPILDGSAPSSTALRETVNRLRPGKTFVHCAQGHGRTGLFALAILLKSGNARTIEEGMQMLQSARPGISLNHTQWQCIEDFTAGLNS